MGGEPEGSPPSFGTLSNKILIFNKMMPSRYRYGRGAGAGALFFHKKPNITESVEKNIGSKQMVFTNRRKPVYRRRRKRRGIIKKGIPRTLQPATKLIRCKMSDYQTWTCTSGALQAKTISGTDITDPYGGASLQQPLGYDQWKALYKTAYVVAMKVKFTLWNNDSTAIMYGISMMDKKTGATALTNYEYYREVPGTVSRLLSPDVDHGYISNKISTKKALHIKDIKDNDTIRVALDTDSAPSEQYYAHAWVQPVDQSATINGVLGVLDVEYIILLSNPITPSRSTN